MQELYVIYIGTICILYHDVYPKLSWAHIWSFNACDMHVTQISKKHKIIWWEHVNEGQSMTWNDFIRLQDITYLD
jgi:hypothetical protein